MKRLMILIILIISMINLPAQEGYTISGFIYDKDNGESLIGANVLVKELSTGASTNISGYYVVSDIPKGKYTLRVSYIGYSPKEYNVEINNKDVEGLKFYLESKAVETEEVIVSADSVRIAEKLFSKPVSKMELSQKEVNEIPRIVEADLLRALQSMPGITSISDFSSALYVRGGTPDQNLYLVDGTDVYNPEHAFGIFSTFNTNAIKNVEVSKGGFGAEYGGRLSSVLDVTNLDGNRNEFEGVFNLSLLSASTTLQIPVGDIGSISGSFRRTYVDQTYAKWIDEVPFYYFYDGNLKGFFDLDDKNKLSISYFNSQDDLDFKIDKDVKDSFGFLYDWGNVTGSVNWKHIFSPKLFSSFWVTASRFESNFEMANILNLEELNSLSDYAVKANLEYYSSPKLNFKFGMEHKLLHGVLERSWDEGRVDIDENRQYSIAFGSMNWKPNDKWSIDAGIRMNYFNSDEDYFNIEPRLTLKYKLNETSSLKFASGIYHQFLNRVPRLFFASIWTSADKNISESESIHFILGYQKEISQIIEFEFEAYYKQYKDIHTFNQLFGAEVTPSRFDDNGKAVYTTTENLFNQGDGNSYGLELMLRKNIGALTGWISYSLSRTEYEFPNINKGDEFIPRHDRSSIIKAVINTDIGSLLSGNINGTPNESSSKWKLGLNFVYATGQPITTPGSGYYVNTFPDWDEVPSKGKNNPRYNLYPGEQNSFRLPDYIRMDISLTYEKDYGSWSLAPYLQIFNVGNRKNVWFITYEEDVKENKIIQKVDKAEMLPILPSLGVTIRF